MSINLYIERLVSESVNIAFSFGRGMVLPALSTSEKLLTGNASMQNAHSIYGGIGHE